MRGHWRQCHPFFVPHLGPTMEGASKSRWRGQPKELPCFPSTNESEFVPTSKLHSCLAIFTINTEGKNPNIQACVEDIQRETFSDLVPLDKRVNSLSYQFYSFHNEGEHYKYEIFILMCFQSLNCQFYSFYNEGECYKYEILIFMYFQSRNC